MGYRNKINEDYEFEVSGDSKNGYEVCLPHQCDTWKILGFETDDWYDQHGKIQGEGKETFVTGYPSNPTNKEFAVSQMELFVKRAQEALEKLKSLP